MNFSIVRYIIGYLLQFEAGFLLLPVIVGLLYGDNTATIAFLITAVISFIVGKFISLKRPIQYELYMREGFATVAFGWLTLSIFGALPFVISGDIPNYIDALFETTFTWVEV